MLSIRKGATKRCCYGICKSDTRAKSYRDGFYYFINFPKPCVAYRNRTKFTLLEKKHIKNCIKCRKCELWVKKCSRSDKRFRSLANVTKDTYICSLHFYGESGPSIEYPDPLSHRDVLKICETSMIKIKSRTSLSEKYKKINDEAHVPEVGKVQVSHPVPQEHGSHKCNEMPMLGKEGVPNEDIDRRDDLPDLANHVTASTTEKFVEYLDKHEVKIKVEPDDYAEFAPLNDSDVKTTQNVDAEFIKSEHDICEFKCELEIESTVLQKPAPTDPSLYIKDEGVLLQEPKPEELQCELFYRGILEGKELAASDISIEDSHTFKIEDRTPSVSVSTENPRLLKRTNKTTYSCDACGRIFLMSITLKIHRCKYVCSKSYSCKVCNSKFQFRSQLTSHRDIHLREEPHRVVEESPELEADPKLDNYDIINSLKSHKIMYTDDRAYICKICDAKFMDRDGLALHEFKHVGKKPFRCNICDLKFVTLHRLISHKRTHNMKTI